MMRNVMIPASAAKVRGLVVFGEFFFDLVFYDLPRIPRMGEEVKTGMRSLARSGKSWSNAGSPPRIVNSTCAFQPR